MLKTQPTSMPLSRVWNRRCLVCQTAPLHISYDKEHCAECGRKKGDAECEKIVASKVGTDREVFVRSRGTTENVVFDPQDDQ